LQSLGNPVMSKERESSWVELMIAWKSVQQETWMGRWGKKQTSD
jgi:hypothetical protein